MTEDVAALTTPAPAPGRKLGRSAVRFVIASAVSFVLNLGLAVLLHEVVGFSEELAYAISLAVAFVTSFLLMRYYVYPGGAAGAGAGAGGGAKQFGLFVLSAAGFRLLEYAAFLLGHTVLGGPNALVIFLVQGTSSAAKFVFYRMAVFNTPRRAADARDTVGQRSRSATS